MVDNVPLTSSRAVYDRLRGENSKLDLTGQIAVIFGGTGGIGSAIAELLTAFGVSIVIVGRNKDAVAHIKPKPDAFVRFVHCDATLKSGLAASVAEIRAMPEVKSHGVDYLVLAVGAFMDKQQVTSEGHDLAMMLGFYAHVHPLKLLMPELARCRGVVMRTGRAGYDVAAKEPMDLSDLDFKRTPWDFWPAATRCGILTDGVFKEMSHREAGSGVRFIHAMPGYIETTLSKILPVPPELAGKWTATAEECAQVMVHVLAGMPRNKGDATFELYNNLAEPVGMTGWIDSDTTASSKVYEAVAQSLHCSRRPTRVTKTRPHQTRTGRRATPMHKLPAGDDNAEAHSSWPVPSGCGWATWFGRTMSKPWDERLPMVPPPSPHAEPTTARPRVSVIRLLSVALIVAALALTLLPFYSFWDVGSSDDYDGIGSPTDGSDGVARARFDRRPSDDEDPARERAWFASRAHGAHKAVMIVQVNAGALSLARNMLCSLVRNAGPEAVDSLVFWAMDASVAKKLEGIRKAMLDGSMFVVGKEEPKAESKGYSWWRRDVEEQVGEGAGKVTGATAPLLPTGAGPTSSAASIKNAFASPAETAPGREDFSKAPKGLIRNPKAFSSAAGRRLFGIYYDEKLSTSTTSLVSGLFQLDNYLKMMELRLNLFVRLSTSLAQDFIFSDADIFYISDPFSDLNLPHGVPDPNNRTSSNPYRDLPDLIYSTDARAPYHTLKDPYEGQRRIPKICGGFFFARANERTSRLYRTLRDLRLNDQWGVDALLDGDAFEAVMVDPLPAGIKERKAF
ncbi:hypothetical protein HK101_001164, partial [Irineochytrium annulatum]